MLDKNPSTDGFFVVATREVESLSLPYERSVLPLERCRQLIKFDGNICTVIKFMFVCYNTNWFFHPLFRIF